MIIKSIIVGVDNMGRTRRETMKADGRYEILNAYDYNDEFLSLCVKEEGCRKAGCYDELLETEGAEAVFICTGAKFHAEQIVKALKTGLHVFVEKPLCSTNDELNEILNVMKKTGKKIQVGHNDYSTDPYSRYIKEEIESKRLGEPVAFEKTTAHSGGFVMEQGDWRNDPDKNPGGMLFQCGVHSLFELMYYFGPVEKVASHMRYDVHTSSTADAAVCILTFKNGVVGTLNAYHVTPYRHNLNVFGTKKNIYVNNRFHTEGTLIHEQALSLHGPQTMEQVMIKANPIRQQVSELFTKRSVMPALPILNRQQTQSG